MQKRWARLKISYYLMALVVLVGLLGIRAPAVAESTGKAAESRGAAPAPRIDYRCDGPAALFWMASALAGEASIESATWPNWWPSPSAGTAEARARESRAFKAFSRLVSLYRGNFLGLPPRPNPWVPLPPSSEHRLEVRFAALFLGARTGEELLQRAEVLLADRDRAELAEITSVLLPKLASVSAAESDTCRFARSFEAYAARNGIGEFLSRAAPLFDAAPGGALTVQFVPALGGDKMRGRRLGSYLIVEVGVGQRPEHRADVVVHEASHWLQERGGMDDDPVLIETLFSAEDPRASRAWGLLSEGTATALGQGLWRSASDAERQHADGAHRWYEDEEIDSFAKALAPALQAGLRQGIPLRTLVPQILAAVPPPLPALRAHLQRYVLLTGEVGSPGLTTAWFSQVPQRAVWRGDVSEVQDWARKAKAATIVVMATWPELKSLRLTDLGAAAPPGALRKGAAVFSGDRAGGAKLLVIAAPDGVALASAVQALAAGPWPRSGWSAAPALPQRP